VNHRRLTSGVPRQGSDDHGSAAAEFAIVVPVLLLLLFTMVTLASVFFDQLQLQAAARDAARVGAVAIADACTTAQASLDGNDVGSVKCSVVTTCTSGAVRMSLAATQVYSVPFLGKRNVVLTATSSFVCPQ
jgi:Flp pilus assembly protein TadG